MATTSYITANGMMLGEVTNGVMRNYGTDALGSVVETVLNGAQENAYAYKPYGAAFAKTGPAADPSFLWNGGSGYRATTLSCTEYYVRNRHFSRPALVVRIMRICALYGVLMRLSVGRSPNPSQAIP